jgi:tetratricopeptide (TPR) repeat protein
MAQENMKLPPEIEQLNEKLLADPKSRVFAQLADAYRKANLLDEAIDTAKKGLEHHPNYAVAHLILGRCYLAKGMYALAREEFEFTIKSDPQNLVGYKLLGETFEKQNMYPEAIKHYQMVLDLEPADIELAEKIANLKNVKQLEPEPVETKPAAQSEPVVIPSEPESKVVEPETPKTEPPAEVPLSSVEIPSMPEVLQVPEEVPVVPETAVEPIAIPPVLAEEPSLQAKEETLPEPLTPVTEHKEEETKETPAISEQPEETSKAPEKAEEVKVPEPESQGPTSTLAEIYVQQGFLEKAIDIYKELIAAQPDNEEYKNRMDELLVKAYPEEAAVISTPAETPVQTPKEQLKEEAKIEETPPVMEEPKAIEPKEEPKAEPAEDPFAKLFAPAESSAQPAEVKETIEIKSEEKAEPISEEPKVEGKQVEVTPADFGALFNDSPASEQKPEPAPLEPEKPAAEAKPETGSTSTEGEDTVSSFQSWLSQIQK